MRRGGSGRRDSEYDLCVIGGGAAGLVVAAGGAMMGAKIALVERSERLGGDCLWHGCVPSKALLTAAGAAQSMRDAARFGLRAADPAPDLGAVMRRVRAVIADLAGHDSLDRFRGLGIDVTFGSGRFESAHAFEVANRTVTARRFVIATGSRPAVPPIEGLAGTPFLTSDTLFDIEGAVPELVVIGGGPQGVELGQALARLGSRVTLLEAGPRLLAREDPDLADVVIRRLRSDGVDVRTGAHILDVASNDRGIQVRIAASDGERTIRGTHLLVATGRAANVEGLGLEAAGVTLSEGRIATDARLRTSAAHIYACGDVAGPHAFTHMAEHQAGIVLRNALLRIPARQETRAVPWCTYTDPELARVGLSEQEAVAAGRRHRRYTFPFAAIDRARIAGEGEGLAKIVCDPRGRLLGAAIAGPNAGELIHEYILAITHRMKASDVARAIHVYPALAQINRKVADERMKSRLTARTRRWLQRIYGFRGA